MLCRDSANYPSLAYEIAEPRSDMNIKVAAFTVSEKSINNYYVTVLLIDNDYVTVLLIGN